jgi:hypothetical protein
MEWLEATLAFAVVMMIFATFVSAIIEVLHRITRIREDGLKSMMLQVYAKIVQPGINENKQLLNLSQDRFVDLMTQTRLLPLPDDATAMRKFIYKTVNAQRLMSLPTAKFLQRFIETKEGKLLIDEAAQQGEAQMQAMLKSIAEQYEDFGESARDFFTRRSRLLSTAIAIILAISVNLDAFAVFKTFLADKGVRQAMIDRGSAVVDELNRVEMLLAKTRSGDVGNDQENLDSIKGNINIKDIQDSISELETAGVPIGWDSAPWKTSSYQDADNIILRALIFLGWIFSVLLGGVLVGLGGPFWYDIFRKLGSLAGISIGNQQETPANSPPSDAGT